LLQYARVRDRRMLLLAALFACQAQALAREWWDVWRDVYQAGVCAAGLALLLLLSPRHPGGTDHPAATPGNEPAQRPPHPDGAASL